MLHKFFYRYLSRSLAHNLSRNLSRNLPIFAIATICNISTLSVSVTNANAQTTFEPPASNPSPNTTIGGGRRGNDGQCLTDRNLRYGDIKNKQSPEQQLTPLLPPNKFGVTLSSKPQLFAYIPKTNAITVEFTLENSQGKGLARKRLDLISTPSIVDVQFDNIPLEVGKDYKWLVSVICEKGDPEDLFVDGIIRRIQPDQATVTKLAKASPLEKVYTYAKLGIWYEAIAELANLKRSQPNSNDLKMNWLSLLKSSNLEALANTPIASNQKSRQ